jgi:LPXTG-motif cell wall-anchored protein
MMRGIRTCLVVAAVVGLLLLALPAQAQTGGNIQQPRNPNVQDITDEQGAVEEGETLPFTGADITLFVVIGLAAIGSGALIIRKSRPRGQEG